MIWFFLEDFVFVGKANSSMVSFTFTMSAMTWQPASVTSQSPKINFLIPCSIKFSVVIPLNVLSGCSRSSHAESLAGLPAKLPVALGWFLNVSAPWKDWLRVLSQSCVVASKICGSNEPAPPPCKCVSLVVESLSSVVPLGHPRPSVFAESVYRWALTGTHRCALMPKVASRQSAHPLWLV